MVKLILNSVSTYWYKQWNQNRSFPVFAILFVFSVNISAQAPSWGATGVKNVNLDNPTSLDFGPNGKLYVSQQDGIIYEYTVERDNAKAGEGTYKVTKANVITLIKNNTPNHNDDGNQNSNKVRQITGIVASGTPENPILYVTSSDWRIGGKNQPGNDVNLDTNSGVLSRLTWNGKDWEKVDLVRGLPRCEENHSTNGMDLFTRDGNDYIFIQQGGNTNQGAPSNNFAGSSEYYLAGALLIVNLTQIEGIEQSNGGPFTDLRDNTTKYVYDLPTINDPERPDINNSNAAFPYGPGHPLYNATIDKGDPFGGNNGLNQAFPEPNGPVQIFSPGYRNAYDVVITEEGDIYTFDNGPNGGWGGPPVIRNENGGLKGDEDNANLNTGAGDYITNEFNFSNGDTHSDQLHYVGTINDPNNTYYAGHPVPIRAFPSKAQVIEYEYSGNDWKVSGKYDWEDLIKGVSGYFHGNFSMADFPDDPDQAYYITDKKNHPDLNILDMVPSSTNGMCVYTASNFNNQLKGNIFAASFNGNINRYVVDPASHELIEKNNKYLGGFGDIPLDVIALGDEAVFPGTIWAVTYGAEDITVFEPADFGQCFAPDEPNYDPEADYDKDGFANYDEVANGTDHCSAGSKPDDADNDFISDLTDTDDDNDGIPDLEDTFALDPLNGTGTPLPITYPFWNNDPGTGMFGLGFTGLMLDPSGQTDYLDMYDPENMSMGGAGGKATVDSTSAGDALEGRNSQDYAFQLGVDIDEESNPFTVHSKVETPFNGKRPLPGQSYGVFIGTGDQDNYVKVVIMNGRVPDDDLDGIAIILESEGRTESQVLDIPGILEAIGVDLYLGVNPQTGVLQVSYSLDNGQTVLALGYQMFLPENFFTMDDDHGLAVGIISTAGDSGTGFTATWDFLNVTEDQPNTMAAEPEAIDFGILPINSSPTEISTELFNLGGSEDPPIEITALNIINDAESLFSITQEVPINLGSGVIQQIPVLFTPNDSTGKKTADLEIIHSGINSPLIVPLTAELEEAKIAEPVVRINAGANNDFLATDGGPRWEATPGNGTYTGTSFEVNTGNNTDADFDYDLRDTSSIPNYIDRPTFNAIFRTERYDVPEGEDMNFSIPVQNNSYLVRIYLGTNFNGTSEPGSRVFDILIEGQVVKSGFDPVTEFGFGVAGVLEFPVILQDGNIDVSFSHVVENPNVYAIEILGYSLFNGVNAQAMAFPVKGPAPLEVQFNGSNSGAVNNIESYFWEFGDSTSTDQINPVHTYTTPGKYRVTLNVSDGENQDTDTLNITVDEPMDPRDFAILINAGGDDATYNGKIFRKDQYYDGGDTYFNKQATVPNIYRSERNANPPVLGYNIPLTSGRYEVILHFAEIYLGATGGSGNSDPGQRVFDVYIENELVLDNYDILAGVGSETVDIKTFTTNVEDGELNLVLDGDPANGGVNRPKIAAIEIYGADPNGKFFPVVMEDIPDQFNDIGESPDLAIGAAGGDPDQNFEFKISGQPEGIDIEPTNGLIFGTIDSLARTGGPNNDGIYKVTISVSKPGSETVSKEFNWTITKALNEWFNKDEDLNYTPRHECSFVQAGKKFFLMGGRENAKTIDVYDYTSNSWENLQNNAPFEFNHFQAVEYQGYIWVIGAFTDNEYPNETPAENIWIFDPLTYQWRKGPEIPESRRRGSSGLVVHNDIFYIIGGNYKGHNGGYLPYFDSYDPATGEWTVLENAPNSRDHFHAVVANDKLYAIGGRLSGGPGGVFAPVIEEVDVYDFNSKSWTTLNNSANLPTPRAAAITVNFKDLIYVAGGEVNDIPEALDITEVFDPVTQEWKVADDLNHGRHGTQGIVSGNGIFVLGGSPTKAGGNQKNMEFFNYDTPSGISLSASEIEFPETVMFGAGETKEITALVTNGNTSVFPDSVAVTGSNSDLYILENNTLPEMIGANNTISFSITYEGIGQEDMATLTLFYNGGKSASVDLSTDNILNAEDLIPVVRINAGGAKVSANDNGPDWLADNTGGNQGYSAFSVNTGNVYGGTSLNYFDRDSSIPEYIDQELFEALYSSEKYDPASSPPMVYNIPLPEGNYTVNLYFGTSYSEANTIGSRVFSISLEEEMVETSFDVIQRFGFQIAGMVSKEVAVIDGELNIEFGNIVENPFVNAIEIQVNGRKMNQSPVAKINTNRTTGYNPLTIEFNARASSDDFGISSYSWDFADGSIGGEQSVSHTFDAAGTYPVVLTVTDIYGLTATDTTYIEVLERPNPNLTTNKNVLDFGEHIIDGESADLSLQITNPDQRFNEDNNIISITILGDDAASFEENFKEPLSLETGESISGDVTFSPATTITGDKSSVMQIVHSGENSPVEILLRAKVILDPTLKPIYRVNAGGEYTVPATDDGPDWEMNPEDENYNGTYYNVFGGANKSGDLAYLNKGSSLPDYLDDGTYQELYYSERQTDYTAPEMGYEFIIPNGYYILNIYSGRKDEGTVIFDLEVEDRKIRNFDLQKYIGASQSAMISIPVMVEDERLSFNVDVLEGEYSINALEILSEPGVSLLELLSLEDDPGSGILNIFPNPTDGEVNFLFGGNDNALTKVEVFDMTGRMVREYNPALLPSSEAITNKNNARLYTVQLDGISKGVYIVVTEDENGHRKKAKIVVRDSN